MDSTPWYKNKSTLAHIFTALVTVAMTATGVVTNDFHATMPGWLLKAGGLLLTFASAVGVYENHS